MPAGQDSIFQKMDVLLNIYQRQGVPFLGFDGLMRLCLHIRILTQQITLAAPGHLQNYMIHHIRTSVVLGQHHLSETSFLTDPV